MRPLRALSLVAFCVVATGAATARGADPLLHVRARLRVDVDRTERVPGGLVVRGNLRDDATDEPVAGRTVTISVEGDHGFFHYAEPSGPDGAFAWRVPLPLGSYRLRIGSGGDPDHVAAPEIDRALDVARRTPILTLHVPERAAARAPSIHISVEAHEADGEGSPRALEEGAWLTIAGHRRHSLVFQSGHAESDEFGPFGRAGQRIEVSVEIEPDELRNGARVIRRVLLTSPTTVALNTDGNEVAPDAHLFISGSVRADDGAVGNGDVVIALDTGAELARFVTDRTGRFSGWVRGRDLPPGSALVEARYRPRPDENWREPAVSPTVPVRVLPAPPVALWPYIVSPALTLLTAALAFAARNRRWRAWLWRRRSRRRAALPPPLPGLTESRPRLLSSLRARADHGLTGTVVDATDHRGIPTATVVARAASGDTRAAAVDERGRFAIEDLPAGELVVEIAARGYVAERFTRTLPHRGELRGARVLLVPVRARIFDAWRRAAAALYPTQRAAETMTPRELFRYVEGGRLLPHEPLAALTSLVESAVWGAPAPAADELTRAESLAAALKADS